LHDRSDTEFEKLLNFDKSFFEEEEDEGYVSLDNVENNYVGNEEDSDNKKFKTFILCFIVILSFKLEICGVLI